MKENEEDDKGTDTMTLELIDQMEIEINDMEEESNEVEDVDDNWVEEMMVCYINSVIVFVLWYHYC